MPATAETNAAALTASERFLLGEVDRAPDKTVRLAALRGSARHMTNAGFWRVVNKMLRRNLLARNFDTVTMTFAGMKAWRPSPTMAREVAGG